jgi:four helix bundle protein
MKARSEEKRNVLFPTSFDHHRLEVYKHAVAFFGDAYRLAERFARGDFVIRDQWLRAALGIPLNIAEGCNEWRRLEKARFYRIARRSAGECAALLDCITVAYNLSAEEIAALYEQLERLTTMLLNLVRRMERDATEPVPLAKTTPRRSAPRPRTRK